MRRRRALSRRGRPRGDAAARERARQGLLGRARRDGRAAARVPEPRRRPVRAGARLGRRLAATSRRSRTWRCRSSARARRGSTESGCRAPRRSRPSASSRSCWTRRRGSRSSTARSSWRRSARSGSCAPAGWPRPPTSPARSRSRRCRARARASCRRSSACGRCAGQVASAANVLALLEDSAIIESHRWCDKVQDAYSLRCAPQVHGATPRPARLRRRHGLGRAERRHRQPARAGRGRAARLERQLPRPAGRVRARRARDGGLRAREHLRAAGRAAREPEPLGRPAGVPHLRRRPQLRLHDPAVRGRVARLREQGALPPGERSTRSRRAPARRITSRWGTRPG